jgi:hypothetical protein
MLCRGDMLAVIALTALEDAQVSNGHALQLPLLTACKQRCTKYERRLPCPASHGHLRGKHFLDGTFSCGGYISKAAWVTAAAHNLHHGQITAHRL